MPLILTEKQREIAQRLLDRGLDFVVVGGKALQFHGNARDSHDLDLWVSIDGGKSVELFELICFYNPAFKNQCSPDDLLQPRKVVPLPDSRSHEVDVLTSLGSLLFEEVQQRAASISVDGTRLQIASLDDLCVSKQESAAENTGEAKKRDLRDLAWIRRRLRR